MGDVELLVTCPTTMTSPPARDGGQVPQYPQAPVLPQLQEMPVAAATPQPPLPTMVTPSPQKPQLPSGIANTEGNPFFRFPHMPAQFPHPPRYPGQYRANDMSALMAQLYMMQQLPQYSYQLPGLPPGFFQPTAPPTPPATTTTTTMITAAPPVKHDGIPPPLQQLQQFPVFPHQYPFLPFRGPLPPEGQAGAPRMLKPPYPPPFQLPMLPNLPPTTSAPPSIKHAPQGPLFNPYPYMPYYVPQQAFMPQFPEKPALPEQHGQQPVNHVPPQFYPSGY